MATALVLLVISGCVRTEVIPRAEDTNVPRLISTAPTLVECAYRASSYEESPRGHQFFLGALPFGTVYTPPLKELVGRFIREVGGVLGIRCVPALRQEPHRIVEIEVDEFSLSGFDFIFFRKPTASVSLRGTSYIAVNTERAITRECRGDSTTYDISRFAFQSDLEEVQSRAWHEAMTSLLTCLYS